MSGHSKWSTIKRQKGINDAKRSAVFTKLGNAITIAAREGGGDPDTNFRLRLACDTARGANMPKENINRAIDRGSGRGNDKPLEQITYEGYGPDGVALMVETVTDNRQRTGSVVRSLLDKSGGSMGAVGSVGWMFTQMGEIEVAKNGRSSDDIVLDSADLGALDAEEAGESVLVYTKPTELEEVKKALVAKDYSVNRAELTMRQNNKVSIEDPTKAKKILDLVDKIDELDDVQKVYANFDIEENLLEQIAA